MTSHSLTSGPATSSTAVKLLQAAAEFVGGEKRLAVHLGISQPLLGKLMAGRYAVPDPLLLRAVDIVLAHREPAIAPTAAGTAGPGGESAINQ